MDFLKRHWFTLLAIGAISAYVGISMGTRRCASCVAGEIVRDTLGLNHASPGGSADLSKPPVPAWESVNAEGQPITSAVMQGKTAVVAYWATFCNACQAEIPALIQLRKQFPEDQLAVIGISVDEPSKDIASFVEEAGINYHIARANNSIQQAFGMAPSLPTIYILDASGRIQFRHSGVLATDALIQRVRGVMGAEPAIAHAASR